MFGKCSGAGWLQGALGEQQSQIIILPSLKRRGVAPITRKGALSRNTARVQKTQKGEAGYRLIKSSL